MGLEVIEVVERRRRWPLETKLKVLMEALEPGASITRVADRHGVSRNLVYTWMRLAKTGRMRGVRMTREPAASFVPVRVEAAPATRDPAVPRPPLPCPEPARSMALSRRRASFVEITLSNGRVVKVDEGIEPEALAKLVAALDGGNS